MGCTARITCASLQLKGANTGSAADGASNAAFASNAVRVGISGGALNSACLAVSGFALPHPFLLPQGGKLDFGENLQIPPLICRLLPPLCPLWHLQAAVGLRHPRSLYAVMRGKKRKWVKRRRCEFKGTAEIKERKKRNS